MTTPRETTDHQPRGRKAGPSPSYRYRSRAAKPSPGDQKIKLVLYTPHAGQAQIHACDARFRVVVCGRRWGKTFSGVNELVKYGWEHPDLPGWWVAPTYSQARKAFRTTLKYFESAIASKLASSSNMEIVLKSGGHLFFLSAERYDNLRGEGVGFMVLDEFAQMPRAAWETVLRPTLSDTQGRCLFIGTPRGKNWAYGLFRRGEDTTDPLNKHWAAFSFPTSSSPYIPDEEIEEARNVLPLDVFNQEYMAEFLDEAAGVFHGINLCVHGELYRHPAHTLHPDHRYVVGWDIAKHTDFSVISVLDTSTYRDGQATPHLCHWERFNTLNYVIQMDQLETVARNFNAPVLIDSTGIGDPIFDALAMRGLPVYGYHLSGTRKTALIQNLAVAIQSKSISYPPLKQLLQELSSYQYAISPSGQIQYGAPEGEHDDTVISLALAVWAAQHPVWAPVAHFEQEDEKEDIISPV